jgi:hypothetical protein
MIDSGIAAGGSTGTTQWLPLFLSTLAGTYAALGEFDEAWSYIVEATTAIQTTHCCEAEIHRIARDIALTAAY